MLFKIAFRNILRNGRRSLMTTSAIAVGTIALLIFGEYVADIVRGYQTNVVETSGHMEVFAKGYFDFGSANPAGYSISGYKSIIRLIENDPALKPMLTVVTPTVTTFGVAGDSAGDASRNFWGIGYVPSGQARMRKWRDYGFTAVGRDLPLTDDDATHGIVGVGLARMLGLCAPLKIADCPAPPGSKSKDAASGGKDAESFGEPTINLLAATAEGAPNIVSMKVREARSQGVKEFDDIYVAMNIKLAQRLLYGRDDTKAVGIVIQLQHTADIPKARARLNALFKQHGLDLEVRDFYELVPRYMQAIGLFYAIFGFIAIVIGIIVLFTVVNTMSMSVMERTNEIGTVRAMGVRRSGIRRQFLIEGSMLGAIGTTAGIIVAATFSQWFNSLGLTWVPPGDTSPIALHLLTTGILGLQLSVWFALVVLAMIAALIPANRAARLPVVDALRHV
jgi:putative ABC transport system permease protein